MKLSISAGLYLYCFPNFTLGSFSRLSVRSLILSKLAASWGVNTINAGLPRNVGNQQRHGFGYDHNALLHSSHGAAGHPDLYRKPHLCKSHLKANCPYPFSRHYA